MRAVRRGRRRSGSAWRWRPRSAGVRRYRETGERAVRRQGHPVRSKLDPHAAFLLDPIDETVDITLAQMRKRLETERGVRAGTGTLWRFFHRRGVRVKKDRACARAGARRHPRGARGLVRGAARARSRAADLHRRRDSVRPWSEDNGERPEHEAGAAAAGGASDCSPASRLGIGARPPSPPG